MNKIEVYQSDALTFLNEQDHDSIHVMITDPPYWTLDKWRNMGTTTRLGGSLKVENQRPEMFFETIDRDYLWEFLVQAGLNLTKDGHLYMFCDDIVAPIIMNYIRESKDTPFEDCHMLIWDKVNIGMGYHYRRRYECIIFAWKKVSRRLRDLGKPDIFQYKRITNGYPTEKPAALITELITQSLRVGETCCDPFAGSGSLAMAVPFEYNATIRLNDKSDASMMEIKKRMDASITPEAVRYNCQNGGLYNKVRVVDNV